MNAILNSGLSANHVEEMFAEKDDNWPFWIPLNDLLKGVTATPEEVDYMYDWKNNPSMALPSWMSIVATKLG